jgi:hypothetical protein
LFLWTSSLPAPAENCRSASASDVIDASVVIVARERQDLIVTIDPGDLRRLDPAAEIITL